jgi:hypothetical protein
MRFEDELKEDIINCFNRCDSFDLSNLFD